MKQQQGGEEEVEDEKRRKRGEQSQIGTVGMGGELMKKKGKKAGELRLEASAGCRLQQADLKQENIRTSRWKKI